MPFILASGSPRRQELLQQVIPEFKIHVSDITEQRNLALPSLGEQIADLAYQKAAAVASHYAGQSDVWILGSDTMVCRDQDALGKPKDPEDAVQMLTSLSNRSHEVMTGLALIRCTETPEVHLAHGVSQVHMRPISAQEIKDYVASGDPMDKAGSYAIQGEAGAFITHIEGEYENIVGLPLQTLRELLQQAHYPDTVIPARV